MSPRSRAMACLALISGTAAFAPAGVGAQNGATVQLAFESNRDGDSDIWVVDSDGENRRLLTIDETPDGAPSWSPDGNTIVYACAPDGNWDLCSIEVKTRRVTRLTSTPTRDEFDPRYTADGSQIVLETYYRTQRGAATADLATVPAGGGVPDRLTNTPAVDEQDPAPSPVPASTQIVYAADANIVLGDTAKPEKVQPLTDDEAGKSSDPAFAGSTHVVFTQRRAGGGVRIVKRALLDSPEKVRSTAVTAGRRIDLGPTAAAGTSQVFFARAPSAKQGLRILRVGTNPLRTRSVTTGAGLYYDAEPAARPVAGSVTLKKTPFEMSQEPCNKIDGSSGADSPLNGTPKRDCIRGMGGNDVINGQGGDDTMTGGAGRDTLTGQAGDDYYFTQGDGFKDHCSGFGGGVNHAWIDDDLDTYTTPMIIH